MKQHICKALIDRIWVKWIRAVILGEEVDNNFAVCEEKNLITTAQWKQVFLCEGHE